MKILREIWERITGRRKILNQLKIWLGIMGFVENSCFNKYTYFCKRQGRKALEVRAFEPSGFFYVFPDNYDVEDLCGVFSDGKRRTYDAQGNPKEI